MIGDQERKVPGGKWKIFQTLNFRRRNLRRELTSTTAQTIESAPEQIEQDTITQMDDIDRHQTVLRYNRALERFLKALKLGKEDWDVEFPSINDPDWKNLLLLQDEVKKRIKRQSSTEYSEHAWSKTKRFVEQIYTTTGPFLKNFLTIAKEASQVLLPMKLTISNNTAGTKPVRASAGWSSTPHHGLLKQNCCTN